MGLGKAPGMRWRPPPSLDDPQIRASILRKLSAWQAGQDIPASVRAADMRAYKQRRGANGA